MNAGRPALALLAVVSLAVGCSSGGSGGSGGSTHAGGSSTSSRPEATTTTAPAGSAEDAPGTLFAGGWPSASGGRCGDHQPGTAGVLMTFCHGPARIVVTTADGPHPLEGVCWSNAGRFEVDAGVTVGTDFDGPWPDYLTLQASSSVGESSNTIVAWIGGKEQLVEAAKASISAGGAAAGDTLPDDLAGGGVQATFDGTDSLTRAPLHVTVDCG